MRLAQARLYLLMVILGFLAGCPAPVYAQDGTWAGFEPAGQSVPLGSPAALKLVIKDGVNVNAFDLVITYDSSALTLSAWSHGGFLSNLSCVHQVIESGKLALACTQIARPGVYGDGTLLNLSFNTLAGGSHEVVIQKVVLAAPLGGTTIPEKQNGVITALLAPTYTATPLPTATRTAMPTFTVTLPLMATPTHQATETPFNPSTATSIYIATTAGPDGVSPTGWSTEHAASTNTRVAPLLEINQTPLTLTISPENSLTLDTPVIQPSPIPTQAVPITISLAEGLLWGALGAGCFAIFIMLVIIIRRKIRPQNKEEKDLLL